MKKILLVLLIGLSFSCGYNTITRNDIGNTYYYNGDTVVLNSYTMDTNWNSIVKFYKIKNGHLNDSTLSSEDKETFEYLAKEIK